MKTGLLTLYLLLLSFGCLFAQSVPDNNTFSLLDVYNVVSSHAPATTGDLQSCVNNSVPAYYDPTYAGEAGMYAFRNYTISLTELIFTEDGSWTVPAGITEVTVEAWGSGAAGGQGAGDFNGGAGGGGGGFAKVTYSVIPGENLAYVIGQGGIGTLPNGTGNAGTLTIWRFREDNSIAFTVEQGQGGAGYGTSSGGGQTGGSGGDGWNDTSIELAELFTTTKGGTGADGTTSSGAGGGGSGAGSSSDGNDGLGTSGGSPVSDYGGAGGSGGQYTNGNGSNGSNYAAGGGGSTGLYGTVGNGANGLIRITF